MSFQPRPFRAVLIANRGEIACRIIRTLSDLCMRSIAVYSDADRTAPHVRLADDAVYLGPSPAAESYLNIEKIIEAAKISGAEAVHPGYGFLSENADFATACEKADLVFIGPSTEAIRLMGDKAAAKRHMIEAGVPLLPGYQGGDQSDAALLEEAKKIGFPLMVKASAGGGGRGMRLVLKAKDLPQSISAARSEALSSFGSNALILERALIRPRHVEIQIFGDSHGRVIHLGERDCSVQRRHQKILEEAPCPVMTDALRERMGAAAVKVAQSVNYIGAGTVEFLLDESGAFFFLEMNTRLQVEHPVTEMVTSLDLVALQIRVAQGERLGLTQDAVSLCGHAIEARLYAEDPSKDFLPAIGQLKCLSLPTDVRIDSGVETGSKISPFYDPMIAKIVAFGPNRETARSKLVAALEDLVLFGVQTNRQFLIEALNKSSFISGEATTAFINEAFTPETLKPRPISHEMTALAAATHVLATRSQNSALIYPDLFGWHSASPIVYPLQYDEARIELICKGPKRFLVTLGAEEFDIECVDWTHDEARFSINGRSRSIVWYMPNSAEIFVQSDGVDFHLTNSLARPKPREEIAGQGDICSPLHGALTEILVKTGESVKRGARLAVVEAMKMQHDILADMDGQVEDIFAVAGTQVAANAPLIKLIS